MGFYLPMNFAYKRDGLPGTQPTTFEEIFKGQRRSTIRKPGQVPDWVQPGSEVEVRGPRGATGKVRVTGRRMVSPDMVDELSQVERWTPDFLRRYMSGQEMEQLLYEPLEAGQSQLELPKSNGEGYLTNQPPPPIEQATRVAAGQAQQESVRDSRDDVKRDERFSVPAPKVTDAQWNKARQTYYGSVARFADIVQGNEGQYDAQRAGKPGEYAVRLTPSPSVGIPTYPASYTNVGQNYGSGLRGVFNDFVYQPSSLGSKQKDFLHSYISRQMQIGKHEQMLAKRGESDNPLSVGAPGDIIYDGPGPKLRQKPSLSFEEYSRAKNARQREIENATRQRNLNQLDAEAWLEEGFEEQAAKSQNYADMFASQAESARADWDESVNPRLKGMLKADADQFFHVPVVAGTDLAAVAVDENGKQRELGIPIPSFRGAIAGNDNGQAWQDRVKYFDPELGIDRFAINPLTSSYERAIEGRDDKPVKRGEEHKRPFHPAYVMKAEDMFDYIEEGVLDPDPKTYAPYDPQKETKLSDWNIFPDTFDDPGHRNIAIQPEDGRRIVFSTMDQVPDEHKRQAGEVIGRRNEKKYSIQLMPSEAPVYNPRTGALLSPPTNREPTTYLEPVDRTIPEVKAAYAADQALLNQIEADSLSLPKGQRPSYVDAQRGEGVFQTDDLAQFGGVSEILDRTKWDLTGDEPVRVGPILKRRYTRALEPTPYGEKKGWRPTPAPYTAGMHLYADEPGSQFLNSRYSEPAPGQEFGDSAPPAIVEYGYDDNGRRYVVKEEAGNVIEPTIGRIAKGLTVGGRPLAGRPLISPRGYVPDAPISYGELNQNGDIRSISQEVAPGPLNERWQRKPQMQIAPETIRRVVESNLFDPEGEHSLRDYLAHRDSEPLINILNDEVLARRRTNRRSIQYHH